MQTACPGNQAERLVLGASSRTTLLDTVGCCGDGLVERVSLQRQLRPGLSQTELPQPLMPGGGTCGGSGSLLQQSFGSTRLVAARERQQRIDAGTDDRRSEPDAFSQ